MHTYTISKNLSQLLEIEFVAIPELSDQNLSKIPKDCKQTKWNKTGWNHTEKTKDSISKSRKGIIPHNKGVPMSEEQKKKISISSTGRIPWNKNKPNPIAAQNGKKSAVKLRQIATGRKRKYLPDGTWTWQYPK